MSGKAEAPAGFSRKRFFGDPGDEASLMKMNLNNK
jgi:hypothetical protein